MPGMVEYQEAEKEAGRESRREASRTGIAILEPESREEATEEQLTRRIRHTVSKRPRASTFQGEPNPKKTKKGSEAEASARMHEITLLVLRTRKRKKKRRQP